VRRSRRVDAQQDLDPLDLLVGDLRERLLRHLDLVGAGVGAGVGGAQEPGQRLVGLVQVGEAAGGSRSRP